MIETKTYRNILGIPDGRYQNRDQTRGDKLFAKAVDRDLFLTNDWQYLAQQPLRREIYFKPSAFPLYDPFDYRNGSAWTDWVGPSGSFIFDVKGSEITVSEMEQDMSLEEYKSRLMPRLEHNLREVYKRHEKIYLHYSGGIDSIVALSFVLRMGYGPRTYLLYYRNLPDHFVKTMPHIDWSYTNPAKIKSLHDIQSDLDGQIMGIDYVDVTVEDYINLANNYPHDFFTSNTTAAMLTRYRDGGHIGGHNGNEAFVHWRLFIDDLVLTGQNIEEFQALCSSSRQWYAQYHVIGTPLFKDKPMVGTVHKHITQRQRTGMQQHDPPLYSWIKDEETVLDIRRLHWRDVKFEDLLDATMARDIIHYNVGTALDQHIVGDGTEGDHLPTEKEFPVDRLSGKIFEISDQINHHPEGREWHQYLKDEMNKTGIITTNSLVSFKAMQMLHDYSFGHGSVFDTPRAIPLIGGQ